MDGERISAAGEWGPRFSGGDRGISAGVTSGQIPSANWWVGQPLPSGPDNPAWACPGGLRHERSWAAGTASGPSFISQCERLYHRTKI